MNPIISYTRNCACNGMLGDISLVLLACAGGYKGYGLAMLVEIFCGILANADYGPNIRFWKDNDREANLVGTGFFM